ncbi:MAG: helix-turn-helix domain-containing protein [Flavobacteriales bacterium]|jgi:transcriptional regulator with XRE-family HTH domain|nr:helix-turn-helix domain-containing protein [Flavobacteriales bacterium]
MSIGRTIKQLRELRDYTQAYMAKELGISVSGYGKIERDETDITLSRLQQIANVLETQIDSILDFESKNVFNQYYNKQANAIVQNLQIINDESIKDYFNELKKEINDLKKGINKLNNE